MKTKFILIGLLITLAGFSQSTDSVLIRGQVISKDKHPLPGVTISVFNTNKIVLSDLMGQFELWSPIEGIVEFSCISEPYRISVSSLGPKGKDELIKFEFDIKKPESDLRTKKLKGRTIRVNPGHISDIILAYYNSDFIRITKKYFDYYSSLDLKIIFMINGQIMDNRFTMNDIDYNSLNNVAIIRITDSADKIIFMMSTNEIDLTGK